MGMSVGLGLGLGSQGVKKPTRDGMPDYSGSFRWLVVADGQAKFYGSREDARVVARVEDGTIYDLGWLGDAAARKAVAAALNDTDGYNVPEDGYATVPRWVSVDLVSRAMSLHRNEEDAPEHGERWDLRAVAQAQEAREDGYTVPEGWED